jgi:hypothetical protein
LRVKVFSNLAFTVMHLLSAFIGIMVVVGEVWSDQMTWGFQLQLGSGVVQWCLCAAFTKGLIPSNIRTVNAAFDVIMFSMAIRLLMMEDLGFFMLLGLRTVLRGFLAVLVLNVPRALRWNVVVSAVTCFRFWHSTVRVTYDGSGSYIMLCFILSEIVNVTLMMLTCVGIQRLQEASLSAQLSTEISHGAVSKVLSVLCDAVVHLGPSGEVKNSSPQLRHLLRLHPEEGLDGSPLADHFASELDQSRFEDFIKTPAEQESSVTALHVNFRRRAGPVVCFHAYLPDLEGTPGHLIGLRETGVVPGSATGLLEEGRASLTSHPGGPLLRRMLGRGRTSRHKSDSVSSHSSDSAPLVVPISWPEITLSVDAFSDGLSMNQCTIHYLRGGVSIATAEQPPLLRSCVSDEYKGSFLRYVQLCVNTILEDDEEELPNYGPFELTLPCVVGDGTDSSMLHVGAMRVERPFEDQDDIDESGLRVDVRLFEISQVILPSRHKRRGTAGGSGLPLVAEGQG